MYDVLAMVKQLEFHSCFLTLSCSHLRREEHPYIVNNLNNLGISEEGLIKNVRYQEQCISLKNNPVLVTKLFFKEIVFNGLLSYTKCYALRIDFPERDRRHIHLFIWISNAPNIQVETAFI